MQYIECDNLCKRYGGFYALKNVGFSVSEPNIIGLVGNNGAGKTTLMSIIAGYLRPSSGDAKLFGYVPFDNAVAARNTILIDEKLTYDPFESIEGIIRSYGENCAGFDPDIAFDIIETFDLPPTRKYKQLSKGMKNQFNIAIGFAANRAVTLMDEPVSGLDEGARREFYKILGEEYERSPRVIVVSTHLLGEFERVAEKIMIMRSGELVKFDESYRIADGFVKLEGKTENIMKATESKKVYDRIDAGTISTVAVENDFDLNDEKRFIELGVKMQPVSVSDACVYLSKTEKKYGKRSGKN